jgi:beta-lactamase regulating signal transducer with metallopeptidase domain
MPTLLEMGLSNALIAGLLALIALACSRWGRPALAHGLWLLVLIKLVTPPVIPVSLPWTPRTDATETRVALPPSDLVERLPAGASEWDDALLQSALAEREPEPAVETTNPQPSQETELQSPLQGWHDLLAPLWLVGSMLWFLWTFSSIWRFQRLLNSARPAPAHLQEETSRLAARIGLRACPRVVLVPGVVSPMMWALGMRPRLLFPTRLLGRLDAEQRAALILHELAHVRRRDHWVRLIELIALGIYWWHPLVWWARRQMRAAEEECCDAWVVWALSGAGHSYATALLQTVAFVSHSPAPLPIAASGIGEVSHLRRRLTMIMHGNTPKSLSATGWLALLCLAILLLPVAAQAQQPSNDVREQEIRKLKEHIRALELDKAKVSHALKVDDEDEEVQDAELQEAQAVAQELKAQIAKKQAELKELQAKFEKVMNSLDKNKRKGAKASKGVDRKKPAVIEVDLEQGLIEKAQKGLNEADRRKMAEELLRAKKEIEAQQHKAHEELLRAKKEMDVQQHKANEEMLRAKKELDAQRREFDRYKSQLGEKLSKDKLDLKKKLDKDPSVEERLEMLMKEVELLRREIRETRGKKQVQ